MDIVLQFNNPTPTHCDVDVLINGEATGTLHLRQVDLLTFQNIMLYGCMEAFDTFLSRGNPNPPDNPEEHSS
jgi:hypothetical protein